MPYGEVRLIPGVNVERTPTLLEAGFSTSQLIRFKDGLAQKIGGWQAFYANSVAGTPRELHGWEDLNSATHLAVGTTTQLNIITSGVLSDITPQTLTTNPAVNFTTTAGSNVVTIVDTGINNVTVLDSVLFDVPITVDTIILAGLYQIQTIVGATSYTINAATNGAAGVSNGGAVPAFATVNGSATVTVTLASHGLVVGNTAVFRASTTGNGVTITGAYTVATVPSSSTFTITVNVQANATGSFNMNGGNAQFVYYINIGPPAAGSGFGLGGFGSGGFGTGSTPTAQTGTEITATDWTTDNWGQILLSCPQNGGVYSFDPTGGFINAGLVATAPIFNGGLFVNMGQQILVCWASTQTEALGLLQDLLLVKWSTVGDFTQFTPLATNQAGSFRLSNGSMIKGGLAASNQNLIWTDLDLWAMNYIGPPLVFGFNIIGNGAGLVSSHAAMKLRGNVYWMGPSNFYAYDVGGVHVLPCSVWDFVFQNLNTAFQSNVRALPNTPFNEAGWAFPSNSSANGECDSYVKFNITEPGGPWDYGSLARSAWIDQTVLGNPIGAIPTGIIYQHEKTNDAAGAPMVSSFTTGYFYIAEGEEYAFVDRIIPDFKWGTFSGAQTATVNISFNVVDYPGGTPTTFGPFVMNSTTTFISVRFRGGLMSITVSSSDQGSFWRLGKVRYRWAPCGRR